MIAILKAAIQSEHDVVGARRRARDIASLIGFDAQDQTRIATAVSEIARNAFQYAGGGRVEFFIDAQAKPQALVATVADRGPGIGNLKRILSGNYTSETGMGLGIIGAKRLVDQLNVESAEGRGTTVRLVKILPPKAQQFTATRVARLAEQLSKMQPSDASEELALQNQELMRVLAELNRRSEELERLNTELEDTNRGVVALYAELEEKAERLKQADQMKSRFLSHMSHEFRTPLNSILALARLLLEHTDGTLTSEQEKQVNFMKQSAENLYELVNDLLDLAKVEAGKVELRPTEFTVANLFGGLRGVLRPLLTSDAVALIFEDASAMPPLYTDEAKLAQILRNYVSNALKFTERGEVRVSAAPGAYGTIRFAVKDTGIGIAVEDQARLFEEFAQIENPVQRTVKGTGLGLSLSRKLAELLGGTVGVESRKGFGSTFWVEIPPQCAPPPEQPHLASSDLLIIDDEDIARYLLRQGLQGLGFNITEAADGHGGLLKARQTHPRAILLDIRMPGMDGFEVLARLKADVETRHIPVIIISSRSFSPTEKERLDAASAIVSKEVLSQGRLAEVVRSLLTPAKV